VKHYSSLGKVQADLKEGSTTLPELVEGYLAAIAKHSDLNIFLEVFEEESRCRAIAIQAKWENGSAGRLAGMVIAIKDNICFKGHHVSGSSRILEGFKSLYSSTAVQRLLDEDAVIIGRVNCDEFAMGSSNENSAFGLVRNPLDPKRVPGGSSGGSAAAVAANMCLAALGSDTGGSVRQPASLCGVIGIKPTYGRISRHGLLAYASSFDQIGPLAHSIADIALILEIISGRDEFDSTLSEKPVPAYSTLLNDRPKMKIGYIKDCIENKGLNDEVRARTLEIIESLRNDGHEVSPVEFPLLDYLVPTYYVLTTAEASSNLARYDGMHFGFRDPEAVGIENTYSKSRSKGFGKEVKRRIMLGTFVLSAGYYDAYYGRAQKVRRMIRNRTIELLNDFDFLLTPTTTNSAFEIGRNSNDPIAMYLEDIYTVQAPLAGIPAISLPLGKKSDGMPFGIQLMGSAFAEDKLLAASAALMEKFVSK